MFASSALIRMVNRSTSASGNENCELNCIIRRKAFMSSFVAAVATCITATSTRGANPTMHIEKMCRTDEAENAFSSVRTFMIVLASRTNEAGQPTA